MSVNVRGLLLKSNRTKPQQLGSMICSLRSLGCVVTESWLTSDIVNPEIGIEGYNVFRSDREVRVGGGVCVYMRQDLTVTKELSFSNDMVEAIILKVEELKGLVIGVYRPPNTTKDKWNEAVSELREGVIKI